MTTFKGFMDNLYGNDTKLVSVPPRYCKSFMSEAIKVMTRKYNKAYHEVYKSVFNEIKEDSEGFYSDKEIHDFIEKYITFELEVEDKGFTETPTIVITPKMKEFDIEEL